jgi:peptidoglycan/xylan/chitin deacetylase (PgdA/CDA1 family)
MYRMTIRLLKIFISIGYSIIKHIIIFLYKTSFSQQCVVLYYHSVLESQRERFIRQLDYLSKKFSFVSLSTPDTPQLKKNLISITFDDGLSSIFRNALPELIKREIPTTIFIPAANIADYPKWEQKDQEIYYEDKIINIKEIKELSDQGVEIASHTLKHTDLRTVHLETAKEELNLSKSILEEITGKKVVSFSFPYGSYNDELISLAHDCGYSFVYTTQPEIISFPTEKKIFGRISVDPTDYFLEFKLKVAGAYSWLPRAIKMKKKIKKFLSI